MADLKQEFSPLKSIPVSLLWWIPAGVPLIMVFSALLTSSWSWWLMEDVVLVQVPGNIWERFWAITERFESAGRFYPVNAFLYAWLYKIFQDSPQAFFFFRFFEVTMALGLWAWLAREVTGKRSAAPVFLSVTLGFYAIYDAYFYLPLQEILGVFFLGAGMLCFAKGLRAYLDRDKSVHWLQILCGGMLVLMAFASKETFVSAGFALGFSILILWFKSRGKIKLLTVGSSIVLVSLAYAFFIKFAVMQGYAGRYSFEQHVIIDNIVFWLKQLVAEHGVWIIIAAVLACSSFKNGNGSPLILSWCRYFGVLAYIFYLLVILPWNTAGHYITPLAVFFAFLIAVFLARPLERIKAFTLIVLISFNLCYNIFVVQKAVYLHTTRQQDTMHLMEWLSKNDALRDDLMVHSDVAGCNSWEFSFTLPALTNHNFGTSFDRFKYITDVNKALNDPDVKYYFWCPYWGDQDRNMFRDGWSKIFVSDRWYVFQKSRDS